MRLGLFLSSDAVHAALLTPTRHTTATVQHPLIHVGRAQAICEAITQVLHHAGVRPAQVTLVAVSSALTSSHLAEETRLGPVAVIRLGGQASAAIPPMTGWPKRIATRVRAGTLFTGGGVDLDGHTIAEQNEAQLREFLAKLPAGTAVAVSQPFSTVHTEHETWVQQVAHETRGGDLTVDLSQTFPGGNLIERENAATLNAALRTIMHDFITDIRATLTGAGIDDATLYTAENDGGLRFFPASEHLPVLSVASDAAHGTRGAAIIAGVAHAARVIVVTRRHDHLCITGMRDGGVLQEPLGARVSGIPTRLRVAEETRIHAHTPAANEQFTAALHEHLTRHSTVDAPPHIVLAGVTRDTVHTALEAHTGGFELHEIPTFAQAIAVGAAAAPVHGYAEQVVRDSEADLRVARERVRRAAQRHAIRAGAAPETITVTDTGATPFTYSATPLMRMFAQATGKAHT